jgi:hypothetical protein
VIAATGDITVTQSAADRMIRMLLKLTAGIASPVHLSQLTIAKIHAVFTTCLSVDVRSCPDEKVAPSASTVRLIIFTDGNSAWRRWWRRSITGTHGRADCITGTIAELSLITVFKFAVRREIGMMLELAAGIAMPAHFS